MSLWQRSGGAISKPSKTLLESRLWKRSAERARTISERAGADPVVLDSDLDVDKPEIDAILACTEKQADKPAIPGTPTFLIGPLLIERPLDLKGLQAALMRLAVDRRKAPPACCTEDPVLRSCPHLDVHRTRAMPTLNDSPRNAAEISGWILRQATADEDSRVLIDGIGRALNGAGVPVLRIGISLATLNTSHRGITFNWRRGEGTSVTRSLHGAESEAEFGRSPIGVNLSEGRLSDRWRLDEGEGCDRFPLLADLRREGCTDYLLSIIGFPPGTALRGTGLSYASDRLGGFSEADVALIAEHRDALGLAVLRLSLSRSLRNLLGAYVGDRTAGRVLAGQVRRGEGELVAAAILLVDLKGFSAMADREDPKRLVGWLDEHLDALGQDVGRHGGEIFKFTGDGFIAVFPVLEPDASPCTVCGRALATARAGLAHNRALEARRKMAGDPALPADLALHYGHVVYGNIGTASRLDFTAIGRSVNEASRIETLCDTTGRNILMSDSFARRCDAELVDLGTFSLRGIEAPQRLWTVAEG